MMRWYEEFELKHVELIRCVDYFHHMGSIWESTSISESRRGYAAFARRQSTMYKTLQANALVCLSQLRSPLIDSGGPAITDKRGPELIEGILDFRRRELAWLPLMAGIAG